jgi:protein TonB
MTYSELPADLDELVFIGRNKSYGAYQLRKLYRRETIRAFIVASLLLFFVVAFPKIVELLTPEPMVEEVIKKENIEAKLTEPPPMNEKEPPPPPPPSNLPPPPARETIKFLPPTVVEDEKVKDPEKTIISIDSIPKDVSIGTENISGTKTEAPDFGSVPDGTGDKPVEVVEVEKEPDPNEFIMVEQEPKPTNLDEIKKKIGYPPMAQQAGIQGKVIVKVLLDKTGAYANHKVIKSPHNQLTDAVVAQIKTLRCTPAIQAGKPIKFWITIPFDFKLH